jgi:hypothetical protein
MIGLKKGSVSVTLDRVIKTVNGSISGIKMITYDPSVSYIEKVTLTLIDVKNFHEMIRHFGVDGLKKTANIQGLKLKGEFKVCADSNGLTVLFNPCNKSGGYKNNIWLSSIKYSDD